MPERPPRDSRPFLPGTQFVSEDRVKLMIEQALNPITQSLTEIKSHNLNLYGNGSGRKGKIEQMEDVQTDRWEEQRDWREVVNDQLTKLNGYLASKTAVAKDRRWIVAQILTGILIALDIWARIHGK